MSNQRTRITVDGLVVQILKNGTTNTIEYTTLLEALTAAKVLLEASISELEE